jgi:hypothetical protein
LKAVGTAIVALVIVFEEWGWGPLARMMGRVGRWPPIRWIELRVAALPPHGALFVFCIPALLLAPVKLAALWLIGEGRVTAGVVVLVLAKILGTAVVARIFLLTQPQLMRLPWFARGYRRWLRWRTATMGRMRASRPWALVRGVSERLHSWWAGPR